MRPSSSFFLALCSLASLLAGGMPAEVVDLTVNNFDELTNSGPWLLDFYAPWCSHCKQLEPIYYDVAKSIGDKINMGKIDCVDNSALQKRFNVSGFPTLIFLRDGEPRVYRGERTREALSQFIDTVSGPAIIPVNAERLKELTKTSPVLFVFLGSPSEPAFRAYEQVARRFQGIVPFVYSSQQEVMQSHGAGPSNPAVLVLADGDKTRFTGAFDLATLRAFVTDNQFPLLSEVTAATFADLTARGLTALCITDPSKAGSQQFQDACRDIARQYKGKFTFAHLDGLKHDKYLSQFGLTPTNYPLILVFDFVNEQFYHPTPGKTFRTKQDAYDFLNAVWEGKIEPVPIGAWWSPARVFRWFEKWVSQFSDTQLLMGAIVLCVVLASLIFFLCCGPENSENEDDFVRSKREIEEEDTPDPREVKRDSEGSASDGDGAAPRQRKGRQQRKRNAAPAGHAVIEDDSDGNQ